MQQIVGRLVLLCFGESVCNRSRKYISKNKEKGRCICFLAVCYVPVATPATNTIRLQKGHNLGQLHPLLVAMALARFAVVFVCFSFFFFLFTKMPMMLRSKWQTTCKCKNVKYACNGVCQNLVRFHIKTTAICLCTYTCICMCVSWF